MRARQDERTWHAPIETQFEASREKQFVATVNRQLKGDRLIREAALRVLSDSLPQNSARLPALSPRQWRQLLQWLDLSGLALYLLDRLGELQQTSLLPADVLAGLQRRLDENTERTRSMTAESIAIQKEFQRAGVWYSTLKGLSYWPSSVPLPELRLQFDLDFLLADEDLPEARDILLRRGYRLYGNCGRSWEFKRNEKPGATMKDLYKDTQSWRVELHVEQVNSSRTSQLERLEWRELYGFAMPALSPIDLFLGQGLHAFKHICSEYTRASHLVEFRRHVLFRRDDTVFWSTLQRETSGNPRAAAGLGVTILLITQLMGEFAPVALTSWTVDCLPAPARLWVEMYGSQVALGKPPGTKLYLLLQSVLESPATPGKRSLQESLLPACLPPPEFLGRPGESLSMRLARYRVQLGVIVSRLRFHVVEDLRYAWESHRWKRLLARIQA